MDRSAYERWWELEKHFWRIGRRHILLELIEKHAPRGTNGGRRVLDIGGACSILSQELARFGEVTMVEPDAPTAMFAKEKFGLDVRVGHLPNEMPVDGQFDIITLFDVIEHIEDDYAALSAVRELLRPGGLLVLTVPALMLLWSDFDVANHHFRRYEKAGFRAVVERSGFSIERLSYFSSLLFPLVAVERVAQRVRGVKAVAEYEVKVPPRPLNETLLAVMEVERVLLRKMDMPIGSSLFAICHRD
jgi:SAM-dependent methyltransferase